MQQIGNYTIQSFEIKGPLLISPKCFGDERGFFTERYRADEFQKMGLPNFVQDNYSRSQFGVLRGLHFQFNKPAGKLVSVSRGRIFDVLVDIRKDSPTFGRNQSAILSGDQPQWFWVPAGFAHGFVTLSESADFLYKTTDYYAPEHERALAWDDPHVGIEWPLHELAGPPAISAKDAQAAAWGTCEKFD